MAITTGSIPPYRHASDRANDTSTPSLREISDRRCGRWLTQGADMRWYHSDDSTLACVDPDTLEPYV